MFRKVGFGVCLGILWAVSALADPPRIVALGDSLTEGYGLPAEQGLVPRLEEWVQTRGKSVEIVNAGVSGDSTTGGAMRVAWSLSDGADAMIVILGGNDVLRGTAPAVSRDALDTILRTGQEKGVDMLLVGIPAPGNYGPEYKEEFDAIYPELAQTYGTLFVENFFASLTPEGDPQVAQKYMQPDGIHPNAEGVGRIVEALGPKVLELLERVETR